MEEMQHRVMFRRVGETHWTTLSNKRTGQPLLWWSLEEAQAAAAAVRGFTAGEIETSISSGTVDGY